MTATPPSGSPRECPAYPPRVSENKRYFVDQKGRPIFWLGTTQWQLFRDNTPEEARTVLERTAAHGFAYAQVMLLGVGDGTKPNFRGDVPCSSADPLTPNERYFENVDAVLRAAADKNVIISFTLFHQCWRDLITEHNARGWARWVAERYRDVPGIVWSMTPEALPESTPVLRELAAGLREGDDGAHLVTFKPDPAPHDPGFLHDEPWLDFSCMQVFKWIETIYPMVTMEYNLQPTKPVVMAEGAYEDTYERGEAYDYDVTPLWVRREAYYSYLAGAHHTYGHKDSFRMRPNWRQVLDAPGAVQMGVLKRIFLARDEWWNLVPDQSILASGGRTDGRILNLAARHADGRWLMAYLAEPASVSVWLDKLVGGKSGTASWVKPETGEAVAIGDVAAGGTADFTTPEGWDDAVLIIE